MKYRSARTTARSALPTLITSLALLLLTFLSVPSLHAQQTTFTVTVGASSANNPNGGNAHDVVFYLNAAETPELTLVRGVTYTFNMSQVPRTHQFYISASPKGGGAFPYSSGVTGQGATDNQTLTFTPPMDAPSLLYYQCESHEYMGWKIHVVNANGTNIMRFKAHLAGDNEVPSIETGATGDVRATLDGDTLWLGGNFRNLGSPMIVSLSGTAHLHLGYAGETGPVAVPLKVTPAGGTLSGLFDSVQNRYVLTAEQRKALLDRRMYINVHSTNRPMGEIRGQLVPEDATVYTAVLTGRAEIPANRSTAVGGAVIERYGDTLRVSGSFHGLESDLAVNVAGGAHIHSGMADTMGGILHNLMVSAASTGGARAGVFRVDSNTFVMGRVEATALGNHGLYINVHSLQRTGGEIRGQIVPDSAIVYEAWLAGLNEVLPRRGAGQGGMIGILDGNSFEVSGNFTDLQSDFAVNISGGSHIFERMVGKNGGIVRNLIVALDSTRAGKYRIADNTFTLSPTERDSLMKGDLYVNIRSLAYQTGDIRGQLLPAVNLAPDTSSLILPGSVVTFGTDTSAQLTARWYSSHDPNGNDVAYFWEVSATPDFSAVLYTTPQMPDTSFSLSYGQISNLLRGSGIDLGAIGSLTVYHRVIATDGSLWSMSTPGSVTLRVDSNDLPEMMMFRAHLAGHNEVPAIETRGSGDVVATLSGDTMKVTGTFIQLGSNFNPAIAGGAHIHTGYAGTVGPVAIPLTTVPDAGSRGGEFPAIGNTYVLTPDQKQALLQRQMYVNVHSINFPGGEIRGQLLPADADLYWANLSGRAELPGNLSPAVGAVAVELRGEEVTLTGSFTGLGSGLVAGANGASHLHRGPADSNSTVITALSISPGTGTAGQYTADENIYTLNSIDADRLRHYGTYVNVHTQTYNDGEIRGQVVPQSAEVFEAWLASYNEPPAQGGIWPQSNATGNVIAILDSNTLRVAGTFSNLSSRYVASHIHIGQPGVNGGVAFPLSPNLITVDNNAGNIRVNENTFTLTPAQVDSVMDGKMYVNVHTQNYPGGEIRGQLLTTTNYRPTASQMLTPTPNGTLEINSDFSGNLRLVVSRSNDPNGNQVIYQVQLSSDTTFSSTLTGTVTVNDTVALIPAAAIGAILDSADIQLPITGLPVVARVIASDGSLRTVSPSFLLTLQPATNSVDEEPVAGSILSLAGMVPNPVAHDGALRFSISAPSTILFSIYDQMGREVATVEGKGYSSGDHEVEVDLSGLPSGSYLLRMTAASAAGSEVLSRRFYIVR